MIRSLWLETLILCGIISVGVEALACSADLATAANEIYRKAEEEYRARRPGQGIQKGSSKFSTHAPEPFYKVDTKDPRFEAFDGVGIVTGQQINNIELESFPYGSSVLISSCHVVTAAHVSEGVLQISKDRKIFVSLGHQCQSKGQFTHPNLEGSVVSHGMSKSRSKTALTDWSIIKLKTPVRDVPAVRVSPQGKVALLVHDRAFRACYPAKHAKKGDGTLDFKNLLGQFVRLDSVPSRTITFDNDEQVPGCSGGGVFSLAVQNGKVVPTLQAVMIGQSVSLRWNEIRDRIEETTPGLPQDIESGRCD